MILCTVPFFVHWNTRSCQSSRVHVVYSLHRLGPEFLLRAEPPREEKVWLLQQQIFLMYHQRYNRCYNRSQEDRLKTALISVTFFTGRYTTWRSSFKTEYICTSFNFLLTATSCTWAWKSSCWAWQPRPSFDYPTSKGKTEACCCCWWWIRCGRQMWQVGGLGPWHDGHKRRSREWHKRFLNGQI